MLPFTTCHHQNFARVHQIETADTGMVTFAADRVCVAGAGVGAVVVVADDDVVHYGSGRCYPRDHAGWCVTAVGGRCSVCSPVCSPVGHRVRFGQNRSPYP